MSVLGNKPHPRILMNHAIETIAARRVTARAELYKLCADPRTFRMTVPVQTDDTDEVLSRAFDDSERLEQEIYRLRTAIKTLLTDSWGAIPEGIRQRLEAIIFEGIVDGEATDTTVDA